jgi:hypothetical protein
MCIAQMINSLAAYLHLRMLYLLLVFTQRTKLLSIVFCLVGKTVLKSFDFGKKGHITKATLGACIVYIEREHQCTPIPTYTPKYPTSIHGNKIKRKHCIMNCSHV